jgi:hypothetical protein
MAENWQARDTDLESDTTPGRTGDRTSSMVGVMDNARSQAQNVVNQLPAAADTTRQWMDQATRQMQSSSDEMLMVGTALSAGIALGLFVTGTNRLAVGLALLPSIAMGATLMDRRSRPIP